jgi:hypothetical protein
LKNAFALFSSSSLAEEVMVVAVVVVVTAGDECAAVVTEAVILLVIAVRALREVMTAKLEVGTLAFSGMSNGKAATRKAFCH